MLFTNTATPPTPADYVQDGLFNPMDADFANLLNSYNAKMGLVWGGTLGVGSHPNGGLTVQEVMAAAGTSAGMLVAVAGDIRDLINKYKPGTLTTTTPLPLTTNQDGTVTVGEANQ